MARATTAGSLHTRAPLCGAILIAGLLSMVAAENGGFQGPPGDKGDDGIFDYHPCRNNTCDPSHGTCTDVFGSVPYACSCRAGYVLLSGGDWNACTDVDECKLGYCSHNCSNSAGGYTCSCPKGFILDDDKRTCIDINECDLNGTCQEQSECINSVGGFVCVAAGVAPGGPTQAFAATGLQKLFTDEYFIVMLAFHSLVTVLSVTVALLLLKRSKDRFKLEVARKQRFYERQQNTLSTLRAY